MSIPICYKNHNPLHRHRKECYYQKRGGFDIRQPEKCVDNDCPRTTTSLKQKYSKHSVNKPRIRNQYQIHSRLAGHIHIRTFSLVQNTDNQC